jgi:hypothetical protein
MEQRNEPKQRRRGPVLALAAVLAATTLTGGAAVMGLTRQAPPAPVATQVVAPAAAAPTWRGDD